MIKTFEIGKEKKLDYEETSVKAVWEAYYNGGLTPERAADFDLKYFGMQFHQI